MSYGSKCTTNWIDDYVFRGIVLEALVHTLQKDKQDDYYLRL